jgi:matrixin
MNVRLIVLLVAFIIPIPDGGKLLAFETNGRYWDEQPIGYYVNPTGCPVLENGDTIFEILEQATANWEGVACADVSFICLGETDAIWANDDQSTIYCVDQDWMFGEGAAGATLWLPKDPEEPQEVDLALNAADFAWIAGGGDGMQSDIVDPLAVTTHELGHWLGLAHTPEPFASMYYALLPNGMGATLAADDKAGICSLYPNGQTECLTDSDCEPDWTCVTIQDIQACREPHDSAGDFCSKDYLNCEGMCWVSFYECSQVCLFTAVDYSEGYCAPLCNDSECPQGFDCTYLEAYDVNVCMLSETPQDGSDGDSADGDSADGGLDGGHDAGLDAADGPVDTDEVNGDPGDAQTSDDTDDAGVIADRDASSSADDSGNSQTGSGCGCRTSASTGFNLLFGLLMIFWLMIAATSTTRIKSRE